MDQLQISDTIQIACTVISSITSIIAIIISVITLKQNSVMIEESSRAIIGIYGDVINPGTPLFFIVIKNFGNSLATITKFESDFDFTDCYGFDTDLNLIQSLSKCSIAPGQSKICKLNPEKINRPITFKIEYISGSKKYNDKITIDLKAGCDLVVSKVSNSNNTIKTISYTLQEMLQKKL